MKNKDFKVILENLKNKLEEDSQESKSKKNKLRKTNLIKIIFFVLFFPTMYIIYFHYVNEDKASFPGIMLSLVTSGMFISVIYSLIYRMYIGKLKRTDDFSYLYFPMFVFGLVLTTLHDYIFSSIHNNNDYIFLIKYRDFSITFFLLIISFFITRKIYWFVFDKKNSDSDSNNENNP
jgi:hypothetical protein